MWPRCVTKIRVVLPIREWWRLRWRVMKRHWLQFGVALALVLTLLLLDFVFLDKSHLLSVPEFLHGRNKVLLTWFWVLNIFLPAQTIHQGALLNLLCSSRFHLLFQGLSSKSSLRWLMLHLRSSYHRPSAYLRVREQKMRRGGEPEVSFVSKKEGGIGHWFKAVQTSSLEVSWLWLVNPRLEDF